MIKKIIWIISLLIIIIGLSPVQIPKKWHDNLGENYVQGFYYQTTGGDFYVEEGLIVPDSFKLSEPIYEVNLIGNTPSKKFGFDRHYDVMSSDFILKGKIVGIDTVENVGAFNIFQVDEFYLVDYVTRFMDSIFAFKIGFALSLLTILILLVIELVNFIKHKRWIRE